MGSVASVWTVKSLRERVDSRDENGVRIRVPHFQRSVVWDAQQKEKLISSLLRGYPVGSLLLYEQDAKNYLLVDGLQRTTAIREYSERPLEFLPADQLPSRELHALHDQLGDLIDGHEDIENSIEGLRGVLHAWLRTVGVLDRAKGFETLTTIEHVAQAYGIELERMTRSRGIVNAVGAFLDETETATGIDSIQLPVVVYSGPEDHLPEIFELLNSQGTELGKYDIFAATWVKQACEVADLRIRDAVREKYRYLVEEKGYEIIGVGPNLEIEEYSLFEYLFGLGKVLSQNHQLLFHGSSSPADPDSIAFTLVTIAHALRLSEMKSLPGRLRDIYRNSDDPINLRMFENALLDACGFVEEVIRPYAGMKLNRRDGKPLAVHTEYQIASLICAAMAVKYTLPSWSLREGWETVWDDMRAAIPQHYLYDILLQSWRGAGDTRLFTRVWERRSDGNELVPSSHYRRRIQADDWSRVLDTWFAQQQQKTQFERGHIDSTQKVFLSFLYSSRIPHLQLHQNSFEIEHLIPVSRIAKYLSAHESAPGWPISTVGNLALFTQTLNREKSSKTLREYVDEIAARDGSAAAERTAQRLEPLLFCPIDDAVMPDSADPQAALDAYLAFTRSTFEVMKNELMAALGVEE